MPGECQGSELLSEVHADGPQDCLQECKDYEFEEEATCGDFSYYQNSGVSTMKHFADAIYGGPLKNHV